MKKNIDTKIGFADGEMLSLLYTETNILVASIRLWNNFQAKLTFKNVLCFFFSNGDVVSDIYEIDNSPLLHNAIIKEYGVIPEYHPFKLYQVEDISDFPLVQVVAEDIIIEYI